MNTSERIPTILVSPWLRLSATTGEYQRFGGFDVESLNHVAFLLCSWDDLYWDLVVSMLDRNVTIARPVRHLYSSLDLVLYTP
jgi:hypothetical protein